MNSGKKLSLLIFIAFIMASFTIAYEGNWTEEQMVAYRTMPAVVLIYSGMYVKITLKSIHEFQVPIYGSGSGFFINPDGYLATNGHVVDIYKKYMDDKTGQAHQVLNNFIINRIIQEFKQTRGHEPTQEEITNIFTNFMRTQQPQITDHSAINYVLLSNSETFRFELKKFSPSISDGGEDIAVLKIERENCPVIMLGDSNQLVLQQPVFTIGFPAIVDPRRFPLLGKENTLNSSITRGSISALKTDYKGMSVIQLESAASPGNSGGPTVDIHGNAIGIHNYSATLEYSTKFCVPINTVKMFLLDGGVEFNKTSEFSAVVNKLMDSVLEEQWVDAQRWLNEAIAYMNNQPQLENLKEIISNNIHEVGNKEKIGLLYIVFLGLLGIIIVVLLIIRLRSFTNRRLTVSKDSKSSAPVKSPDLKLNSNHQKRFQDNTPTAKEKIYDMKISENILSYEKSKRGKREFDVFMAYNSNDVSLVEIIYEKLKKQGLNPWFDKRELPPGRMFQVEIEEVLPSIKSIAIFVGPSGVGPWEKIEIRAALNQFVRRNLPIIPVLLPGVDKEPKLPVFLSEFSWVHFEKGIDNQDTLNNLIWGITGKKPNDR